MSNVRRTLGPVKESGRTRIARGSLTAEAILDAAEGLAVDSLERLTVRSVAAALTASPMALYRYFPTKADLVDAMLDRVLGRVQPSPATGDWRADLASFARAHRRVLADHPWAVSAFFSHANPGPNASRVGEHALGILARGGVGGPAAVAAFSGVIALNYGWCGFTLARPEDDGPLAEALAALPPDRFPATVAVAAAMAGYGSDAHYDAFLDTLVRGIGELRIETTG
ncbi:MAG: TetR/AcrR family transcriptional regulator [Propionicimonas sp.]|nr:TetR/AcrR family transcriptional regulator [Propionicimonas sp.]